MQAKQLEQLLHQEIPITQALAIEVLELEQKNILVKAPFDQNKNIHNTAFAGSIYTTATLAGWSLLTNYLKINDLPGSVVLASAEIKYQKPVNGDIIASCQLPNTDELSQFHQQLTKKKRGRLTLEIAVTEEEKIKAKFIGQFAVV